MWWWLGLLSWVSSVVVASSNSVEFRFGMDGQGCASNTSYSPEQDYSCHPYGGWTALASTGGMATNTSFSYLFSWTPSHFVAGSWGLDPQQPEQGFFATAFAVSLYSLSPFVNTASFPTLVIDAHTGQFSCNVSILALQEPCQGQCQPVNHSCAIGPYRYTWDTTKDQITIQYYVNALTTSRAVATRNNQPHANLGFIAWGWDPNALPLVRTDVLTAWLMVH